MNNVHDVSKAQAQEISEILSRIKEKGLSSSSGSSIPDVSSGDLNLDSLPSLSAPNDTIPMSVIMGLCEEAIMSMLGMEEVRIAYTGQESTVVTLKEEAASLDDVVVTGIITRHRNSFTGSASTFSGQELKIIGNSNILQSLKTLEPSMNIVENNLRGADPNTMPDLEIRGKTSIVGEISSDYENVPNQPLFILDGMEVTIETIMNLNIDRVKSVTVLKDAASTAIYGSKATAPGKLQRQFRSTVP